VGYRPSTPDNAPAIGPGALQGLTWATGHHRNGILLAPLTAEMVVASLQGHGGVDAEHRSAAGGHDLDELLAICDPGRFASPTSPAQNDPIPSQ
jgi:hypothetical protein